jgi:hypothetical protein
MNKMSASRSLLCIATGIVVLGLGCRTDGGVAAHYGDAFYANSELMVANPDAGKEEQTGSIDFEGNTVETLMNRYRRGQTKTQTTNLPTSILSQAGSSSAK